jgi:hypothetical protein
MKSPAKINRAKEISIAAVTEVPNLSIDGIMEKKDLEEDEATERVNDDPVVIKVVKQAKMEKAL